ncbi:MAG: hypothetical protein EBY39_11235 [Flavobacteriia bacterium]|nr:hypothetical protein [Flavobacteriia bacterium]
MKKILLVLLSTFSVACGSTADISEFPKWVQEQPDLCGVGIYKIRGSLSAARTFSVEKGRTDLSRKLETKVRSMVKDYEESGETGGEGFEENLSRAVFYNLSKTTINGSNASKLAVSNGHMYTLVCIKTDGLTDALNGMNKLSAAQRKALSRRAQAAQNELEEQMKTYN